MQDDHYNEGMDADECPNCGGKQSCTCSNVTNKSNTMIETERRLTIEECLEYELRSHCFASWIWFRWGQNLMGSYMAWKVRTKHNKYIRSMDMHERVRNRKIN